MFKTKLLFLLALGPALCGVVVASCFAFFFHDVLGPTVPEKFSDDSGLFFVVSYKRNGAVDKQLLCDDVRKNPDKKELVCREWQTGEYYIFSYPVSITDVTLAKDYIKFTNTK